MAYNCQLFKLAGEISGYVCRNMDVVVVILDEINLALFVDLIDQVHPADGDLDIDIDGMRGDEFGDLIEQKRQVLSFSRRNANGVLKTLFNFPKH